MDIHTDEIAGRMDHSTAGAQFTENNVPHFGRLFSYLIAGHHAGLANGIDASDSNLEKRLKKRGIPDYRAHVPTEILAVPEHLPAVPFALQSGQSLGFFLRVLFSPLVDAEPDISTPGSTAIVCEQLSLNAFP